MKFANRRNPWQGFKWNRTALHAAYGNLTFPWVGALRFAFSTWLRCDLGVSPCLLPLPSEGRQTIRSFHPLTAMRRGALLLYYTLHPVHSASSVTTCAPAKATYETYLLPLFAALLLLSVSRGLASGTNHSTHPCLSRSENRQRYPRASLVRRPEHPAATGRGPGQ